MRRFEVQVEQLAGALVIRPVGEADFATASIWRSQMLAAIDGLFHDVSAGVELPGAQASGAGYTGAGFARTDLPSTGRSGDGNSGASWRQFRVILDLTELSFMDSSGLQVLIIGYRHAVRAGAYCCVAGATPAIASRMSVAGLTPYIPGYPTVAEALDHR
ncbi:STAS domain-containing protein [Flindersiella endophytica]